jgi:hypothetical protein
MMSQLSKCSMFVEDFFGFLFVVVTMKW